MLKLLSPKKPGSAGQPPAPEKNWPNRSIEIGVACTLLFHVLIFWLAPYLTVSGVSGQGGGMGIKPKNRDFNFQLTPSDIPKPPTPQKDPSRFVETNPDAPENTPDKTDNFSNRNQQSAQAEAAAEKDPENRPSVQGQDEIKTDNIVTGEKAPPELGAPPAPTAAQNEELDRQEQKARAEQIPLEGDEKLEGKSDDGVASNIAKSKLPSNRAKELQEGNRESQEATGGLFDVSAATSKPQPKARPRLTPVRPSILSNRITGTANVGPIGYDARWSEYGDYMQEFIDIVDAQWRRINSESAVSPKPGTHVIVTFKLNSRGETEITNVVETAGKTSVYACQAAIEARQPYRKWSEQMIAVLGDSQTLTFSFYYN